MPSGLPAAIFSSPSSVVTFSPGKIVTSHLSGNCWMLPEALGALGVPVFVAGAGGGGSLQAVRDDTTTRTASERERMRAMLQSSEVRDEIGARRCIEIEPVSVTGDPAVREPQRVVVLQ